MATTKDRGPGLAYTTRPDGRVRGTYDGKYTEFVADDVTDEAEIVRHLRETFALTPSPRVRPIPATGLPPLD